jgi:hypothetical protein
MALGDPINLVRKWVGHAQLLSTTKTNADAAGAEERQIMEKMWGAQGFTTPVFLATFIKQGEVITNEYDISFWWGVAQEHGVALSCIIFSSHHRLWS